MVVKVSSSLGTFILFRPFLLVYAKIEEGSDPRFAVVKVEPTHSTVKVYLFSNIFNLCNPNGKK